MTLGPFWPICVGMAKQLALMYWCGARFAVGLHVSIGLRLISGVPSNDVLLTAILVPGIVDPLTFMPKFWLWPFTRFWPLSNCVMPESCQPLMNPPNILSWVGFPNSME